MSQATGTAGTLNDAEDRREVQRNAFPPQTRTAQARGTGTSQRAASRCVFLLPAAHPGRVAASSSSNVQRNAVEGGVFWSMASFISLLSSLRVMVAVFCPRRRSSCAPDQTNDASPLPWPRGCSCRHHERILRSHRRRALSFVVVSCRLLSFVVVCCR